MTLDDIRHAINNQLPSLQEANRIEIVTDHGPLVLDLKPDHLEHILLSLRLVIKMEEKRLEHLEHAE